MQIARSHSPASKPCGATARRSPHNLTPEDQSIQSMPDVSPTKWHLAHTTLVFRDLHPEPLRLPIIRVFDPAFAYLFNSYYEAAGPRHPRPERGLLSRPTVDVVGAYRDHVGAAMARFVEQAAEPVWQEAAPLVELGLHHEQQHQELILMDIKHVFSINPLLPAYQAPPPQIARSGGAARLDRFRRRAGRDRPSRQSASPSTTRRRGTRSGSIRSASRRAR